MYVPNAFTPDLDGRNDVFRVQHHALREDTYHIAIYDRLGSLVHNSNDPNDEWDGTNDFTGNKLGTGVFTYYISYKTGMVGNTTTPTVKIALEQLL